MQVCILFPFNLTLVDLGNKGKGYIPCQHEPRASDTNERYSERGRMLCHMINEKLKAQCLNLSYSSGMLGTLQLLKMSKPLSTEQKEFLATILTCAKLMRTVINSILDFSKMEDPEMKLVRRNVEWFSCRITILHVCFTLNTGKSLFSISVPRAELVEGIFSISLRIRIHLALSLFGVTNCG